MPNIFSCDPSWTKRLVGEQKEVILVAWSEHSDMNAITERLAELESISQIPVMVLDCDNCAAIPESFGLEPGEVTIFKRGQEVGKIASSSDTDGDIAKLREIAAR